MIKIVECPRDAMQGLTEFVPTELKAEYINLLLKVGFDTIDFGSFVSPKAIPQMRDTAELISLLDLKNTKSKLLAIIANERGAEEASTHKEISYLGFPFSVSETFQKRNTNSTISESLNRVEEIQKICSATGKQLVVYLSMGFGNPYNDEWSKEIVLHWVEKIYSLGIRIISIADTVGVSNPENIKNVLSAITPVIPDAEIGVHLHSNPVSWQGKIEAAFESGCTRFDSAVKGFGGCPMADDVLVGNIATENLISFFEKKNTALPLDEKAFQKAMIFSSKIFHL